MNIIVVPFWVTSRYLGHKQINVRFGSKADVSPDARPLSAKSGHRQSLLIVPDRQVTNGST
jgi:hypothetical protein